GGLPLAELPAEELARPQARAQRRAPARRLALERPVHARQQVREPADVALDDHEAQARVTLRYAAEDQGSDRLLYADHVGRVAREEGERARRGIAGVEVQAGRQAAVLERGPERLVAVAAEVHAGAWVRVDQDAAEAAPRQKRHFRGGRRRIEDR